MSVINTNVSSIQAQNSMRTNGLKLSSAMERLSSGVRINAAKDDAAGLAISTRMTAEIKGLAGAVRNANDGISLTQTAEGALESINNNLQRIRELAVQSANATNSVSDRQAMHNEASQLISEIDRVAANSTFNGVKLLDGSYNGMSLQVGSGNNESDRLTLTIANAQTDALGVRQNASYSITSDEVTPAALTAGGLSINGTQIGKSESDGVSYGDNADGSAIAKATAINKQAGTTGVWATVGKTTQDFTAGAAGSFSITVNGVAVTGTTSTGGAVGASEIAAAFNAVSAKTGVTAKADFSNTNGDYTLTAEDGRNIVIGAGADATSDTALGLGGTSGSLKQGKVTLTSSGADGFTVGGTEVTAAGLTAATTTKITGTAPTEAGVRGVDLTSVQGSQDALATLDSAINSITNSRASLGAYQNRLTAAVSNIETSSMNLQASRSRIMDTDYGAETSNLAKAQIISQAATAMLAQANQSSQSVLALLK